LFHIVALLALLLASPAFAQDKDKKEEKKKPDPPRIIMTVPIAVSPGQKDIHMMLRGLRLDGVTTVTLGDGDKKIEAKIKGKGAAKPPDKYEASQTGDTKADIGFDLPADLPEGTIKVTAVNEGGASQAFELTVIAADKLVMEKEPNDSFKTAQPLEKGKTILGTVPGNNHVDVFSYAGKAGEKVTFEVLAARLGSALDASITLFDPSRNIITMADDIRGEKPSRDAELTLTLTTDGTYLIVLQDALDRGEQTHSYLLRVMAAK
jgi:hypothetical protein